MLGELFGRGAFLRLPYYKGQRLVVEGKREARAGHAKELTA